ncbi:FtsW/RodA/SpoVE family cell cycle protein [Guptibacillus algicola]|uniref:FtsW/RodA/SpoVE family cell cycle protein n=1 Tax=Guptibacillus algicola TaxID=225844 RepID=UPI001CD7F86E|nr:FtsW/RodA/SpoVE family cell cycle protein [Alkalihalobacillus algicola]MCA0987251.1 FtsW/RodA/SpoVE family cell cycle protein [Alkalihalobacillus algicola]
MKSRDFLNEVVGHMKSHEARELVTVELEHHVESEKKRLIGKGYGEEEAERLAVEQMGNPEQIGQRLNKIHRPKTDWWLIGLLAATIGISFLPLLFWNMDTSYFPRAKFAYTFIGVIIVVAVMFFDYRKILKWKWAFYGGGLLGLLLPIITPTTYVNGKPILTIGSIAIQGSEIILLFYLAFSCFLLSKKTTIWKMLLLLVIPAFLFLRVQDATSLFIFGVTIFVMLWFSDLSKRKVAVLTTGGLVSVVSGVLLMWSTLDYYQKERFIGYMNPKEFPDTSGYMYLHLKDVIADAGWFGQNSKELFIPSGHTDFVFVSLTYHFGWLTGMVVFIVLTMLMVRMIFMTMAIRDQFGQMLVIGGLALFSVQFLYSVGMIFGLVPIVSLSLPFISYGLSQTLVNSVVFGLVLSVYRRKDLVLSKAV